MDALKRFRLMTVRLSLLLTGVSAGILALFSHAAAFGILGGGIAGTLSFWIIALKVEKLAKRTDKGISSLPVGWNVARFILDGIVLYWAYTLDQQQFNGILAAVAGLFIVRGVQVFLGMTGLDQKKGKPDGTDR